MVSGATRHEIDLLFGVGESPPQSFCGRSGGRLWCDDCSGGGLVVGNNAWWSVDLGEKSAENVIYFLGVVKNV